MAQASHFTDGAAYDQFMARWSRGAGAVFLDWLAPPAGARWLEVGCGTGAFTELVLGRCSPAGVAAIDSAAAQIEAARGKPIARDVDFRVADAQELPFEQGAFDVVASSLVINFIPDRPRALAEMRRVARSGGTVAGYVWDLVADLSPTSPLRSALSHVGPRFPRASGAEDSTLEALSALFAGCGLSDIATRTIDVTMTFADFGEFWRTQTPEYTPAGKAIAALSEADRERLIEWLRARLPAAPDGSITYAARANAVKARAPR
jgi:ubiquinone/menaquinone biosynthesis C-methylase UbiE